MARFWILWLRPPDQTRATRERLIAAGRQEFARHGYAQASLQEIVRRAEVTKGAFYHHFTNKKDLFRRVFEDIKKELGRAAFVTHLDHEPFVPAAQQPRRPRPFTEQSDEEVWELLLDRCERYIRLHIDPEIRQIVLADSRWVLDWAELQQIENEQGIVLLRADLRRARNRGIIRTESLHMLSKILTGALNEACMLVVNSPEPEKALQQATGVIAQLLSGLRFPGPTQATPPRHP